MRELDKVLDKKEKVLWEGKPSFWPFFLGRSSAVALFSLFWLVITSVFMIFAFPFIGWYVFLIPHFWVGFLLFFGPLLYNGLVHKNIYYAITDKRILLQKGIIGRDFELVDFDQISNAEVNVGVVDKLFGGGKTGSILLATPGSMTYTRQGPVQRPYMLSNITNPYDVFKFFKQVAHDVKTDIQFPNKYRPGTNTGYGTQYKPKGTTRKKRG